MRAQYSVRVAEFDDHVGRGEIEAGGMRFPFHCTAIVDGTRAIRPTRALPSRRRPPRRTRGDWHQRDELSASRIHAEPSLGNISTAAFKRRASSCECSTMPGFGDWRETADRAPGVRMPPTELARISMPDPEGFLRQYVLERQPVVIRNLFEGQAVSTIKTIGDAMRAWGTMPVHVQEEYARAEGTAQPSDPTFMTFADYVALTRSNRSTRLCCTEYDTPAPVLTSFQLPSACKVLPPAGDEIFGLPRKYGDFDLATNTFIANEGNVAHLHFDGDQRQVLLHQVYGRKRVILFKPSAAIHLRTLDGPFTRPSLSGLYLENMCLEDKLSLVDLADGYHTVLEPGETIYIPMLMWHHLEYLDDAMSFSIRFGRTRIGRFLSLDNFHRDPYIQNVASKMVDHGDRHESVDPIIEDIKTVYVQRSPDLREKVREMRALFRALCAQLCPDARAEGLCPPEREDEQISRIVESKDMEGGLKYADPVLIARTRPVGAMTARQRQLVQERFRALGYTDEVERAVLGNRFGKADVDELTKGEAGQLIGYLNTPAAAWERPERTHP